MKRRMLLTGGGASFAVAIAGCLGDGLIANSQSNDDQDDSDDNGNETEDDESDEEPQDEDDDTEAEDEDDTESEGGDDESANEDEGESGDDDDDEDGDKDDVPDPSEIDCEEEIVGRDESEVDFEHSLASISSDGSKCTIDLSIRNITDDLELTLRAHAQTRYENRHSIETWNSERVMIAPGDREQWSVTLDCEGIDYYRVLAEIITWDDVDDENNDE